MPLIRDISVGILVASILSCVVVTASHCPDKSCQFHDNGITVLPLDVSSETQRLHVPWKLSQYPDYTLRLQTETLMNKQINLELKAFYTYTSMAYFFSRDDINLKGFHEFFKKSAAEEITHAQGMMAHMNDRGAKIRLGDISVACVGDEQATSGTGAYSGDCESIFVKAKQPERLADTLDLSYCDWQDPLVAATMARKLELEVYQNIVQLHNSAQDDVTLQHFLETYIEEQVSSIKELADLMTQLKRVEPCVGYYLIDRDLK